mmetsp:Transcript_4277/g.11380  ORF Transcript_4277/g.11380 Transcript_4277/m.11380 type:complete len:116 (-) Transcript_4277:696-1043(-)
MGGCAWDLELRVSWLLDLCRAAAAGRRVGVVDLAERSREDDELGVAQVRVPAPPERARLEVEDDWRQDLAFSISVGLLSEDMTTASVSTRLGRRLSHSTSATVMLAGGARVLPPR